MKKIIILALIALSVTACKPIDIENPTLNVDDANVVTVLPEPLCISGWLLGYDGQFLLDPLTGAALPCGDNPLAPEPEPDPESEYSGRFSR